VYYTCQHLQFFSQHIHFDFFHVIVSVQYQDNVKPASAGNCTLHDRNLQDATGNMLRHKTQHTLLADAPENWGEQQ